VISPWPDGSIVKVAGASNVPSFLNEIMFVPAAWRSNRLPVEEALALLTVNVAVASLMLRLIKGEPCKLREPLLAPFILINPGA
jgi:hypothetical protein